MDWTVSEYSVKVFEYIALKLIEYKSLDECWAVY